MSKPLDPRFAKIVAFMRSTDHEGERSSARARAGAVAAGCGRTFEEALAELDGAGLRGRHERTGSRPTSDAGHRSTGGRTDEAARPPRWTAAQKEWQARRAAIVARYGSEAAAIAPCVRERALVQAVGRWRQPRDGRWTQTLDGREMEDALFDDMPPHVEEALARAYPLPTSLDAAEEEFRYWEARGSELRDLTSKDGTDDARGKHLDLVAVIRQRMIRRLILHDLRLTRMEDVKRRLLLWSELSPSGDPTREAILRDVEIIIAMGAGHDARDGVDGGPRSMHAFMEERVGRMLKADPHLADRAIATAAGCSPTTVGRIRERLGLSSEARRYRRREKTVRRNGRA